MTSGAGDNNGYQTSPGNAYADDGLYAVDTNSGTNTNTSCTNSGKDRHGFSNYGFAIPGGASIQGIDVRLNAKVDSASGAPKICVELSWNGGTSWTGAKSTGTLATSEGSYIVGGVADSWGHVWSDTEFSNANFRVRLTNVASKTSRDFSLDRAGTCVICCPVIVRWAGRIVLCRRALDQWAGKGRGGLIYGRHVHSTPNSMDR